MNSLVEFKEKMILELSYEQKKRINKLDTDEFYLLEYTGGDLDATHLNLQRQAMPKHSLTFKISGSTKNIYNLEINKLGFISCDCLDIKTHCRKNNCYCKHICFLLLRVLKIFDLSHWHSLRLTDDNIKLVIEKLKISIDLKLIKKLESLSFEFKKELCKDDECSICYDTLNNNLIQCPDCSHGFHKKCMDKWLLINKNCVYCRSNIWTKYNKNYTNYLISRN
jgi:hypothetical protein